jgi:hypothetical protein
MARVITCLHNFWLGIENWEMLILMILMSQMIISWIVHMGVNPSMNTMPMKLGWFYDMKSSLKIWICLKKIDLRGRKVLLHCIRETTCCLGDYKWRSFFFLTQLLFYFQICTYLGHCKFIYNFLVASILLSNYNILFLFLNLLLDWKKGIDDDLHFSRV